jgi:hypothetical protein
MNTDFNLDEIKISIINDQNIEENDKNLVIKGFIESRISHLRVFLNDTDYQVIKCYEAQLLQEEMPYDLQTLLNERKAWRDEINQLEFEISMLG